MQVVRFIESNDAHAKTLISQMYALIIGTLQSWLLFQDTLLSMFVVVFVGISPITHSTLSQVFDDL